MARITGMLLPTHSRDAPAIRGHPRLRRFVRLLDKPQSPRLQLESREAAIGDVLNARPDSQIVRERLSQAIDHSVRRASDLHFEMQFMHFAMSIYLDRKLYDFRIPAYDVFHGAWKNINPSNRDHVIRAAEHSPDQSRTAAAAWAWLA